MTRMTLGVLAASLLAGIVLASPARAECRWTGEHWDCAPFWVQHPGYHPQFREFGWYRD